MARGRLGAVMLDDYEPTPKEIAAFVERMLVTLADMTAAAPSLKRLGEQLRLAKLSAERQRRTLPRAVAGAPSSAEAAEAADDIAGDLLVLAARAEFSGLAMLAYLIGIAQEEAEARARARP
jgi:hypothetical protein